MVDDRANGNNSNKSSSVLSSTQNIRGSQGRGEYVSAVVRRDGDKAIVLDLDLAIYCHMLHKLGTINLPIVDVIKLGWGQHEVIFHDPKNLMRKLEVEFANSRPHNNFASAQRSLKRVMRNMVGKQYERHNQRGPVHNP